jgi:methylase of polypeptide subunit release factors
VRETLERSHPTVIESCGATSHADEAIVLDPRQEALVFIGRWLRDRGYRFVTPTPATHQRVLARRDEARDLRDVLGWNRAFAAESIDGALLDALRAADAIAETEGRLRATVRFSTLDELLLAHSGFPTTHRDSVFLGPDTYRFARTVSRELARKPARRVVEVGCGTAAAALLARRYAKQVVGADVSRTALRFAAVNAELAGVDAELVESDVLQGVEGSFDLVIANPPYLVDEASRTYRDGGGQLGIDLSIRIVRESLARTERLVLYTGTPILAGRDPLLEAVEPLVKGRPYTYEELDPDVFGEELAKEAYRDADRIAVVALIVG